MFPNVCETEVGDIRAGSDLKYCLKALLMGASKFCIQFYSSTWDSIETEKEYLGKRKKKKKKASLCNLEKKTKTKTDAQRGCGVPFLKIIKPGCDSGQCDPA